MNPLRSAASVMAFAAALTLGAAHAQTVTIVTTPAGSYTNSSGAAIAKVLIDHAGLHAIVQAEAANGLDAVNNGIGDFGLGNSFDTTFYVDGARYYKAEGPHHDLRYVASFQPFRVGMFVRKNSDIRSLSDLMGKRVSSGFDAQKTIGTIVSALLANGGLSYKDVIKVPAPNVVRAAQDFMSGRVDVLFFALGSAAVKEASARVGGLRVLPLDTSPAAVARMEKVMPGSYVVHVKPAPNLEGVTKPTSVIAFNMVLYTSINTPDDVIYRATKALHDNKAELAATFKPFRAWDPSRMATPLKDVPYDPGALKYYKEIGLFAASVGSH
jgi:uncharacterized protein